MRLISAVEVSDYVDSPLLYVNKFLLDNIDKLSHGDLVAIPTELVNSDNLDELSSAGYEFVANDKHELCIRIKSDYKINHLSSLVMKQKYIPNALIEDVMNRISQHVLSGGYITDAYTERLVDSVELFSSYHDR